LLEKYNITQPFKQAHREIYILTDAERTTDTYSNRFAAHIIRQHQFAELCKQRAWSYGLQGQFFSDNTPTLEVAADLQVQFLVEPTLLDEVSDAGICLYVSTDQVRFSRKNGDAISLAEIDEHILSEVFRDVDLFVGVCGVGNDPNWHNRGDRDEYWYSASFGDLSSSAQTRRAVLEQLVPSLKIASRCSFSDKFMIVKGRLRTYKIHLGSGNILMEPNDQYLCIVRAPSTGSQDKLYLPFEGDGMLSVVLSKAFLLADDDKIEDPTITRQIKRD
ncbi:MAG: DUF4132 domain-containing protein, partial [Cyanobacteria bacterium]|nr:DUF4132 domain-containing protein [Cyanobacteriota bacterium]